LLILLMQIGTELRDGLRQSPGWIAFARENGTVCHTYTVTAPDPFVAPYHSFLLERTPKESPQRGLHLAQGRIPRLNRKDPPGATWRLETQQASPCPTRCPPRRVKDHRSTVPRQRRSPLSARDTAGGGCA
jgi:hypothetical protein